MMDAPRLVAMADDDLVQAELVRSWLEILGFQVLAFASGDELIRWARSPGAVRPDAVLLDVEMPGTDGFDVCRALRALPPFHTVRVAFVSSLAPERLEAGAREAGANASWGKDGDLLPHLAEWLSAA
jgi:diguanylate cyclase